MFTYKSRIGRYLPVALIIALVLPLVLGSTTASALASWFTEPPVQGEPVTPFQSELADAIHQRFLQGLPVPTVTFIPPSGAAQSLGGFSHPQMNGMPLKASTVSATTVVFFNGPQEAGYDVWPAEVISGSFSTDPDAYFSTGDLTDVLRAGILERFPGIDFGHEARRYTITETFTLSPSDMASQLMAKPTKSTQLSTSGDILMGFTYTGPHLNYAIEYQAEVCIPWTDICGELFYIHAGFEADWAFGLRLPASVSLQGPDQIEQGTDAYFQTSLTPQDWNAAKYGSYGVSQQNGNEFVAWFHFFAGVDIRVVGEDVCPSGFVCHLEFDQDISKSFTTPFGTGSSFPIDPFELPIYSLETGIFNFYVSLTLTPLITSTNITADWRAVPGSDCSGSGTVTYSQPDVPVTFGPVSVCNLDDNPNTNQAQVELKNFRYYFNNFNLVLGYKIEVDVFDLYHPSPLTGTILNLDLGPIFGGLYLGDHVQCDWLFNCSRVGPANSIILTVPTTDETPPITSIALAGTAGTNGWFVSDVQFTLTTEDDCGSGVVKTEYSLDNLTWNLYSAPVLLTDEGILTVYYRSTDAANNVETAKLKIVKIDKTPPVITGAPTVPPNAHGWWNTNVVVHFVATDAVSGIFFVTPDTTVSTEGENQFVVGTAIDMAGNDAQVTVDDINIDKTPPVVTISSPLPQTYDNTDSFNVQWSATDALSGIDTVSGDLDGDALTNGQLVELLLLAAGPHTVTVVAMDNASNVTTESVDFFVDVDLDGLIAAVEYMCQQGLIKSPGTCDSLLAKLNNARAAMDRGQCWVCRNVLNAFIHEVMAQEGIHIAEMAADVLQADAQYVIENLDCHRR